MSGRSLVSAAERDGVSLIAVTINAPNDWRDHEQMLDFGFSQLEYICAVSKSDAEFTLSVAGSPKTSISATAREDFGIVVRRGEKAELIYDLPSYLIAPVKAGDKIGRITVKVGGVTVGEVDIVATEDAPKNKSLLEKILGMKTSNDNPQNS